MQLKKWFVPVVAAALIVGSIGVGMSSAATPTAGSASVSVAGLIASSQSAALAVPVKKEDLYFPITPCRIVDTRTGTGTLGQPYGDEDTHNYYVGGTFGFAPQGGKSGGCGVPTSASAVAASVTAVSPSGSGFMRAWPAGQTEPSATVLTYGNFSMGTGGTLSIAVTSGQSLTVKNYGGPTDLVIDIFGYYAPQMQAQIRADGTIGNGSRRVLSSEKVNTGYYRVTFDTDVTRCSVQAQTRNFGVYVSQPALSSTSAYFYVWTLDSAAVPHLYNSEIRVTATC